LKATASIGILPGIDDHTDFRPWTNASANVTDAWEAIHVVDLQPVRFTPISTCQQTVA